MMRKIFLKQRFVCSICGMLLAAITYLAVYRLYGGTGGSDYLVHYDFAHKLPLLKEISINEFLKSVKY